MKQNITVSQLDELSEKSKKALYAWYRDRKGVDWVSTSEAFIDGENGGMYLPQLTIGEMIEFLDKNPSESDDWQDVCINYPSEKLCDGLWSSVKEVLEK